MILINRVALVVAACAAASCTPGKPTAVPAVTAAPGRAGSFVWHDLVTRDPAAASRFYGALLGWKFQESRREGRTYLIARSGGDLVGGIIEQQSGEQRPATWLSYLAVPNLDSAVAQVTAAGGQVLLPSRPAGEYGVIAVVFDPQGAPLGLATVTDRMPGEPPRPRHHQFFWMEYLAQDATTALAFYKDLGGFTIEDRKTRRDMEYHVLSKDRPRAGLFQIPRDANIRPNWLPYVLVSDPASLTARVAGLGGKVLIAPHADVRSGSLAVVMDPTGGAIALQKWPS